MRIFIPVTFIGLRRAADSGVLPASGWHARVAEPPADATAGDPELAAYDALQAAAGDSLTALRTEPEAPRRRAVVVATVPVQWTDPEPDGSVVLNRRVPMDRIVAVYADAPAASADVVSALGDRATDLSGHELLWYASQELADLVR